MFLYISFRWSPEGLVSQNRSPHLHVCAPGIFSDLLRSFQMLKRVGCGKQWEATAPIQSLVKLQSWFPSLRWKNCLRQNWSLGSGACREGLGQNILMMIFYCIIIYKSSILRYYNNEITSLPLTEWTRVRFLVRSILWQKLFISIPSTWS